MNKSILFVSPVPPPYGGIGNWLLVVTDYLKNNNLGIEFEVINTSPNKRSMDGRTLWDRIVVSGFSMLKSIKNFKKEISKKKYDCIHVNTSGSLAIIRDYIILKIAKKRKLKTVYHLHFGRIPSIFKSNSLEKHMLKKALKYSDEIITLDNNSFNELKKNHYSSIIIDNPINEQSVIKNENYVKENCIAYLGWVIETKGINELLKAWESIQLNYYNWKLKIIGPYEKKYLEELKLKYNFSSVEVMGELEHSKAMSELSKASIFTLPSYTEGFPNVIIEAMILGIPIVASSVGSIPYMLSNDCGLIVEPKNYTELKDALLKLIENKELRTTLSNNAKRKSRDYYIENVIGKYIDVWFNKG